jgi:hypothetical protein
LTAQNLSVQNRTRVRLYSRSTSSTGATSDQGDGDQLEALDQLDQGDRDQLEATSEGDRDRLPARLEATGEGDQLDQGDGDQLEARPRGPRPARPRGGIHIRVAVSRCIPSRLSVLE